jgi:lipopolysaccharide heptosyltransferase II
MKVLQVLPSLNLGGVERGVIDLARAMKRRGEEAVVVSSGGELVLELQKMGVTHYTLPVNKKSIFSLGLISKLAEIIEREHIDVIHARSRVPAWIAWFAARRTGVPFVTTCHGYYSNHPLSKVMGWGKQVIVISRVIGRHMIDDFGVSPERIRLIHRGVDLSQFLFHSKQEEGERPFRIINVGRLSPIKGQLEFLQAIHQIRREIQPLEVWIVGSEEKGKTKYTDQIKQTLRQLDLESCVKLLGTRRDIPELLAQSDLLVLSTLVPEAFGRVVIEAGAVGTPVLATQLGGVLDIIDSGQNGILVAPGDIKAMANAIQEIAKDKEKAKTYAINLREKVQKQFTLDGMVDKTLEVYRDVMAQKKILVIKLGAMGDVILAVPSLRMLRERYPNAWISLLVDRKLAPLVSICPYINEVIPVDRKKIPQSVYLLKLARKLRKEGFDASVDLQNSKWTHLLAFLGGVRERYGFRRGPFGFFLNRPDHTFDVSDSPIRHQFRILSKLGVREFDESLELWAEPDSSFRVNEWLKKDHDESKRYVGFVIGSSPRWATKRWPIENYEELAKRLEKMNCKIVLIGSPEDAGWFKGFQGLQNASVINLIGKTSLQDLVAVIQQLDVLVTGDTAPLHVASAVGTKIVALFGPTDAKRHMPPAQNPIVLTKHVSCQPCYQGTCHNPENLACLRKSTVDEVFQAVKKQISTLKQVTTN